MFGQVNTRIRNEVTLAMVLVALLALVIPMISVYPANASTKTIKNLKSEEIKCKPTMAKAHDPKEVTPADG